ncbi:hypothethical protein [Ralstonia solanacearum PSI07]|nr:hypothethical protein [Ralstonia solanacearum PSI07]
MFMQGRAGQFAELGQRFRHSK